MGGEFAGVRRGARLVFSSFFELPLCDIVFESEGFCAVLAVFIDERVIAEQLPAR